jgi:hypothetical protein
MRPDLFRIVDQVNWQIFGELADAEPDTATGRFVKEMGPRIVTNVAYPLVKKAWFYFLDKPCVTTILSTLKVGEEIEFRELIKPHVIRRSKRLIEMACQLAEDQRRNEERAKEALWN